ncbi:hypothetical protein QJS10_CPA05g00097 [Acorus calamus]|uniref:Uncharacterized protein n=1 Tax=Acorus calamus TaxID=4465 RepID=A0AAV9ERV4_ACOCL|nr:hypothetical protein QJS10_CPA05g00097 [Acorus calamus]
MKENMKWHRTGRRRRTEAKELAPIYMQSENEEEEEDELTNGRNKEKQAIIEKWDSGGKTIRKRFRGRSPGGGTSGAEIPRKICKLDVSFLKKQRSPAPQSFKPVQLKPCHDKKIQREITSAICKFFYHAAIPFHVANSPYFQKMLDLVGQHGQGLKAPSSRLISGRFLQDEVKMFYVMKSVEPILQVLLKLDGKEGLSMPSIYNDMYRAKLAIKAIHADDERKYGPFLNVIDNHWTSLFHHPLYVAAYLLNPQYRYRPDFTAVPEVIRGLNYCIVRLEPDTARRVSASMQEILYNEVEQVDAYENEANENDGLDIEALKSLDITTLTEVIEPSEVHLPVMIIATDDDDADLEFLDDELSD